MRVKNSKLNKVNVITLGCSKNVYDSEVLMGQLAANEIDVEHESKKDDANIVSVSADTITIPNHFFVTGEKITYSHAGIGSTS